LSDSNEPSLEIRLSCELLELNTENLSRDLVIRAWKERISTVSAADEDLIKLNVAKDFLLNWLEGNGNSETPTDE